MINKLSAAGIILCLCLTVFNSPDAIAGGGKGKTGTKRSFSIVGDITNLPEQMVMLELLRANDSVKVVDSQRSNAGHFAFAGTITEPGLYRVHFAEDKFVILSIDKGETKITAAAWPFTDYTVTGSAPSIQLKSFIDTVIAYITVLNNINRGIDSMKKTGSSTGIAEAEQTKTGVNAALRDIAKRYSTNTIYQPNAIIAARILNPQEDFAFYESLDKTIDNRFPGTAMTRDFHQFFKRLKESIPEPNEIGDKAADLILEDTNGKKVTLSSLQGKYVLLDFWASWCGPCRAENPNVLAAFKKFKNKNFTILAVSLDNNKGKWLEAVHHDALLWPQVSDLKGWQSPAAAKYGVHSIPSNFLIDPKGVIIGKNLRGPMLEDKLGEVLK